MFSGSLCTSRWIQHDCARIRGFSLSVCICSCFQHGCVYLLISAYVGAYDLVISMCACVLGFSMCVCVSVFSACVCVRVFSMCVRVRISACVYFHISYIFIFRVLPCLVVSSRLYIPLLNVVSCPNI